MSLGYTKFFNIKKLFVVDHFIDKIIQMELISHEVYRLLNSLIFVRIIYINTNVSNCGSSVECLLCQFSQHLQYALCLWELSMHFLFFRFWSFSGFIISNYLWMPNRLLSGWSYLSVLSIELSGVYKPDWLYFMWNWLCSKFWQMWSP